MKRCDLSYADIKTKQEAGYGWEEYRQKYGFDRQELVEHLYKLLQRKPAARKIIRAIDENTERKEEEMSRATRRSAAKSATTPAPEPALTNATLPTPEPVSRTNELAELKLREDLLSRQLMGVENDRKGILGQSDDLTKRMASIQEEFEDLVKRAKQRQQEATSLGETIAKLKAEAHDKSVEIKDLKANLDEVRQRIEALTNVVLAVDADGNVSLFEGELTLDDVGFEAKRQWLLDFEQEEVCQDLTLKGVKALARILAVADNAAPRTIEVVSEIDGVEQAYAQLRQAPSAS